MLRKSVIKKNPSVAEIAPQKTQNPLFWLALPVALVLIYSPLFNAQFLWDDDRYVYDNVLVKNPQGLWDIWTTIQGNVNYWPMSHTAFWAIYQVFGANPLAFHSVNIVLHGINVLLLGLLLCRLGFRSAWWVALGFAFHPLQVESVAWISELKNTTCTLLALLSFHAFESFHQRPRRLYWWGISLILFLFSMTAKTATAVMPALLILRLLREKNTLFVERLKWLLPFFICAGVMVFLFLKQEQLSHTQNYFQSDFSILQRFFIASKALWFYLLKFIVPFPLLTIYAAFNLDHGDLWNYLALLTVLALIIALLWGGLRGFKGPLLGFGFWGCALLPVLGFFDHLLIHIVQVADHYQYFAIIGLLLVVAEGMLKWLDQAQAPTVNMGSMGWMKSISFRQKTTKYLGISVLAIWCLMSWAQTHHYRSQVNLWEHNLAYLPNHYFVEYNLGTYFLNQGQYTEALSYLKASLSHDPQAIVAKLNLGITYMKLGQNEQALRELNQFIEMTQIAADGYYNRGNLFLASGKLAEALQDYNKTIELNPHYEMAYGNRALIYKQIKDTANALKDFNRAIELNPAALENYLNRGNLYKNLKRNADALTDFNQALSLNPQMAEAYFSRGYLYWEEGKIELSLQDYSRALSINPNLTRVYQARGMLWQNHYKDSNKACQDWAIACDQGQCNTMQEARKSGLCP